MYGPVKPYIQIKLFTSGKCTDFYLKQALHKPPVTWVPKTSTWNKEGDVLTTNGSNTTSGILRKPYPYIKHLKDMEMSRNQSQRRKYFCVWIILSFSCRCGGQYSWWGCERITATTPSGSTHFTLDDLCWLSSKFFLNFLFCRACWLFLTNKKTHDPVSYHDPHVNQNHSPALKYFPWNLGYWKINIYPKHARVCKTIGQCSSRKNTQDKPF